MKAVFVCSPLRGDYDNNVRLARELCRAAVVGEGVAAFAPHLLYAQFLSDGVEQERLFGIQSGKHFLAKCDEIWVYDAKGISEGMKSEMDFARMMGVSIVVMPDCWKWIKEREMNGR